MPSSLHPTRRTVMASGLGLAATVMLPPMAAGARPVGASDRHITFTSWWGPQLLRGEQQGTMVNGAGMRIGRPTGTRAYVDPFASGLSVTYEQASWLSPTVATPFGLQELIASWNVETPGQTWVEILVRGHDETGTLSGWYVLGRWCAKDPDDGGAIHRTSVDGQKTPLATVYTDTFHAYDPHRLRDFQLQVNLLRPRAPPGPGRAPGRGDGLEPARRGDRAGQSGRPRRRSRARRAAVLAGAPRGSLPAVGQRRRGLVLGDVDGDGAEVLADRPAGLRPGVGDAAARRGGGLRGPQRLRLHLQRSRQLAVQHRVRGGVRPRGVRHAAAQLHRGRGVHPCGHPADHLRVVREGRARRRRIRHQWSPHGRGRLHRLGRRRGERPGLAPAQGRRAGAHDVPP